MKNTQIIAIDVGNTSTHFGYFSGSGLKKTIRIPTVLIQKKAVAALEKSFPLETIQAIVIASVVPAAGNFLRTNLSQKLKIPAFLLGRDLPVPVKNKYKNPKQVGLDRLVNALAGFRKYGQPLIVIDFGTAITFDVVSAKGEYLGGVIAPGIEISIEALFSRTALLPKIRLKHPSKKVGKDTVESIQIGCSYGIGGLCDRIVEEIQSSSKAPFLVVATGGYAEFMARYCRSIQKIDDSLTMQGIWLAYRDFLKNSLTKKADSIE